MPEIPSQIGTPSQAPKALRAFYGASDRQKATAKAHIGSGSDRPQEVYTPQCIVDALLKLWPEGIALDPCSGPGSIVPAAERWHGTQVQAVDKHGAPRFKPQKYYSPGLGQEKLPLPLEPVLIWTGDGLVKPYRPRTFLNPTYENLQDWLAVALDHGIEDSEGELAYLIPWRSSRKWFREYCKFTMRACFLDPLIFEGYAQSFPAPLVLTYHGDRDLDAATVGLGECCTLQF